MGLAQASASLGSLAGCQGSAEQRVLPQVVSGGRWTAGPNVSSPFEASSSMALSAFTLLCNHHLHPSPEPCCFPTESLAPLSSNPPLPQTTVLAVPVRLLRGLAGVDSRHLFFCVRLVSLSTVTSPILPQASSCRPWMVAGQQDPERLSHQVLCLVHGGADGAWGACCILHSGFPHRGPQGRAAGTLTADHPRL